MIDWLMRLPGGALATLSVASAWFGFNYTVLGERAMERDMVNTAIPACIDVLERDEASRVVPRSGIGELLGMPELDAFEARLAQNVSPPLLSLAAKSALCSCEFSKTTGKLRFDYAVYTATFRIMPIDKVGAMRVRAGDLANLSCGR